MIELTQSAVVEQLRALGVAPGLPLLVHSSWRALRPVEGGPEGMLDALLSAIGPGGTLVMPSWPESEEEPFHRARSPSVHLGILTDLLWRRPGAIRSDHLNAFAALGPAAAEITRDGLVLPPHLPASPVGRVLDLDGQVLLLGVGHDANTTLHLAELLANVPYGVPRVCTVIDDGAVRKFEYRENDHCCEGFARVDSPLRARRLQREGPVGHAQARLMRSRDLVEVATGLLRQNPTAFLHPRDSDCADCAEAWDSITSER